MASPLRSFREKLVGRREPIDRLRTAAFILLVLSAGSTIVLCALVLIGLVESPPVLVPSILGYTSLALSGFILFLSFKIQDRDYGPLPKEDPADPRDRA